jgi:cobaltochelatase CobS
MKINLNNDINLETLIPDIDEHYVLDQEVSSLITLGFTKNRRVLIHGLHGSGKSTHIEQIAARMHWPCIRVNCDSFIGRLELIGHDIITIKNNVQVTEFCDGIIPWATQRPVALILDEYDTIRPEAAFILQRLIESDKQIYIMENNQIVKIHDRFRLFATSNTIGGYDQYDIYHGTHMLSASSMDRWHIVIEMGYMDHDTEVRMLCMRYDIAQHLVVGMVAFANLTRVSFLQRNVQTHMSTRALMHWIENYLLLCDVNLSLRVSFLNKCIKDDLDTYKEMYQRCFCCELII